MCHRKCIIDKSLPFINNEDNLEHGDSLPHLTEIPVGSSFHNYNIISLDRMISHAVNYI